MRTSPSTLLLLAAALLTNAFSSEDEEPSNTVPAPQCTATSSTGSGAFFDLRPDMAVPDKQGGKSHGSHITRDYHSRGYDYKRNFTMNICGPVLDPVENVVGVDRSLWANVSAYYTYQGKTYSIGSESMDLQSRGRKVVLQYTGGSPCGTDATKRDSSATDEEDDVDSGAHNVERASLEKSWVSGVKVDAAAKSSRRRKSTTISFLCDRDPVNTQTTVSFVGADPDECAYFFEARSVHACASAEPHKPGSVGPGSVFGLILVIAVLVYILGGVFYNRTVAHARGWRQLPNYSLWAGIWSFICDIFIIAWSSCTRRIPSARGYRHLNTSPSRTSRDAEAENRLIDQLDEEWED